MSEEHNERTMTITTGGRTVTETDIVTFVNTVGLYEPAFVDMEYIKEHMPPTHQKRFAPVPLIIGIGMGLLATQLEAIKKFMEELGASGSAGLLGLSAQVMAPVFVGDTLFVEAEFKVKRKTSKGHTLADFLHVVKNQQGTVVMEFTETALLI
ncbi:MAG: MaoC family dehydratase [Deltaproteobacteria bacterium]|nr:MaoC family dehydratase [Deltaproteobacteria bacterium]